MFTAKDNLKTFIRLTIINLILLIIAFGCFFREGFGADTISQHVIPLINIETWITYGRYLAYAFSIILYKLGINTVEHYHVFYIMFILNTAFALSFYQLMFIFVVIKNGKNHAPSFIMFAKEVFVVVLSTALIYINGLFCESFMFPECFPGFSLAFLFSAFGSLLISRKKVISGLITLFLSALFYQAPVMVAVICIIGFLFIENDTCADLKLAIKSVLLIIYGAAVCLLTTLSGSIFASMLGDTPKPVNFLGIKRELMNVLEGYLLFFKSGYRLLPSIYLPLFFLTITIILFIMASKDIRKGLSLIPVAIALFGTAMILSRGAEMPRLLGGLYAALSMFALFSAKVVNNKKSLSFVLTLITLLFLFIQTISIFRIAQNHYKSNETDLNDARSVYAEILKYEKETGNTVKKVAWSCDSDALLINDGIYYTCGQINERTLPLVAYSLLTYVSDGREYEKVQMDKKIFKNNFKNKNWTVFNAKEQLVFEGDTLYWCVY